MDTAKLREWIRDTPAILDLREYALGMLDRLDAAEAGWDESSIAVYTLRNEAAELAKALGVQE